MPAFPHGFPFIALFQPACPQERGGTVFSLSLSLSYNAVVFLSERTPAKVFSAVRTEEERRRASRFGYLAAGLNGFSASPAVMRFSVQGGGFLSERRTVHDDGLSASEAAPFPFREIRFSILSDKVKRKDRHPVGFLNSGKCRRNFLKGALKTRREFVEQVPDRNVLLLS